MEDSTLPCAHGALWQHSGLLTPAGCPLVVCGHVRGSLGSTAHVASSCSRTELQPSRVAKLHGQRLPLSSIRAHFCAQATTGFSMWAIPSRCLSTSGLWSLQDSPPDASSETAIRKIERAAQLGSGGAMGPGFGCSRGHHARASQSKMQCTRRLRRGISQPRDCSEHPFATQQQDCRPDRARLGG